MAVLVAAGWPRLASSQGTRPLTPQDITRSESVFPSGLTPDGKALLYLRISQFGHPLPRLFMADLVGGTERELTREIDTRARIMTVAWSPSGRRFVAAGTIGPATMVWAGDRDSGRLEPIKHRPLWSAGPPALTLASEDELILATIPDEAIGTILQAEDLTARQWAKTNEGREPSRSILDSGAKADASPGRPGSWTLLDLRDGSAKTVSGGTIPTRTVAAPDGRSIAGLYRASPPRVDLPGLLHQAEYSRDGLGLEVATVERGELGVRQVEGAVDVQAGTLSWSVDGAKLAFLARRAGGGPELRAFVFEPRGMALAEMNIEGLAGPWGPAPFAWSSRGTLIALKSTAMKTDGAPGRPDWWVIRAGAPPTNLTAKLGADPMQMPSALVAETTGTLLGVAGTGLWRLDPDGGPATNLGARSDLREVRLEWPPDSRAAGQVLISARRGDSRVFGRFDPANGDFTEIARPSPEALLGDFQPATGASVFTVLKGRESSLWASSRAREAPRRVTEANAHLRDIAAPVLEAIHYEDADGRKLHGWLALPPGFARDRRWPMVAFVYPGTVFNDRAKPLLDDGIELLAGRGYVVMLPSMPRSERSSVEPYDTLAKQVIPAVDKAIELGIADPNRLGLMGHSFGGYAVYGLVTQSKRFRAAVASAGLTDIVSHYGQFHTRLVRSEYPLDETFNLSWAETGQLGLGIPLWEDPARYLRNSPIHYVGRVETPLLMLHGDLDFVPIQQAEEFYTSLARRGKRARFVRYWGEGHQIWMSPANYADYWREVFAWFGEM
ncbi:MAG TPA: prolyl oligopeptidase family serine peptidase [Isosphaeraceae bacterium]|jgi:dipeptidyl aminopeptidase/acylaminoacyl peptidase|nr:prolyl oligopeptidase family serine peptidase [Isosphaeraceae bacterium]